MGEKAKKFSTIGAYDAAHASVASMGVRTINQGYDELVQVVAEAIFGGTPETAIERFSKKAGRSEFQVWLALRQCLNVSHINADVLSVVRKAVQLSLEGAPALVEEREKVDIDLLCALVRDFKKAACDEDDDDDIGDWGDDED